MSEKDVLARIGQTLINIQRTELTVYRPSKVKPAKDVFQPAKRRAPLGALIAELRRQVDVPAAFKDTLQQYLDMRNALVHEIDFIPGWHLKHPSGLAIANEFLDRLNSLDKEVSHAFFALLTKWRGGSSVCESGSFPKKHIRLSPLPTAHRNHESRVGVGTNCDVN